MRNAGLAASFVLALLTGVGRAAEPTDKAEAELIRLEKGKWDPPSLGGPAAFMALFADDFVSVEYGTDLSGVTRKTRAEVFGGAPLPPAKFELSEWRTIRPNPDVVLLSYRVHGVSFAWEAFATSVWARRDGRWQTVFYQASTAR